MDKVYLLIGSEPKGEMRIIEVFDSEHAARLAIDTKCSDGNLAWYQWSVQEKHLNK